MLSPCSPFSSKGRIRTSATFDFIEVGQAYFLSWSILLLDLAVFPLGHVYWLVIVWNLIITLANYSLLADADGTIYYLSN